MSHKWEQYPTNQIKENFAKAKSFLELAKSFGYKSTNGQLNAKLKKLGDSLEIDYLHLLPSKRTDIQIGRQYGQLIYLRNSDKKNYIVCKCLACGKETSIYKYNITKQKTCGCIIKNHFDYRLLDLKGKDIGNFVVIDLNKKLSLEKDKIYWNCQCNFCGKIKPIESYGLRHNTPYSCGCISLNSRGEQKISEILTKLEVNFEREYSFPDFFEYKGHPYRFDFAIFYEGKILLLIEYHGKQHYNKDYGWGEDFDKIVQRDMEKSNYCKINKIPLITIPYYDYDKIDTQYLLNIMKEGEKNV